MQRLINSFPRHLATPQRINIQDKDNFYRLVNQYNGLRNLYFSVYNTNMEGKFSDVNLNVIFFDFDESSAIEDVKKFSNYLLKQDIKHLLIFSGKKGFHVYVFTKDGKGLKYPKDTLTNAHDFFINHLKLNMDMHVRGDICRISRIPNSFHIGGQKFCIPITREDLDRGMLYIKDKATQQQWNFKYYGNELFSISKYDYKLFKNEYIDITAGNYNLDITDKTISNFLPCVQYWLLNKKNEVTGKELGSYDARYFFGVYCKTLVFPKSFCDNIAKKYFGLVKRTDRLNNNYEHFNKFKILQYSYEEDTIFPSCELLFQKGLCLGKCDKYKKGGSPLYD